MLVSYHNHTTWSDGGATLAAQIQAARAGGLDELGISDHFVLHPSGEEVEWSIQTDLLGDYVLELRAAAAEVRGLTLRLGIEADFIPETVDDLLVAVPGKNTTAHVLFSLAFPHVKQKKFMVFSDIEDAVLTGEVDAGVIIHENRFTYQEKGLKKIVDLGEFWESETGLPIPLGGIVIKRNIDALAALIKLPGEECQHK
jgi:histidinol phosphatase-like PHP family hydrolase